MYAPIVGELHKNIQPLSNSITDGLFRLITLIINNKFETKKEISYEVARQYQLSEYKNETVDYVYTMLNTRGHV